MKLKRALVSVSDKTGLIELCQCLITHGVQIISTGGTAACLKEAGINYLPIEELTGNPESFGGRMKTLSFEVGSALLFRRDHAEDVSQAESLGIEAIDLVVCNLYPFQKAAKARKSLPELIENIDIGGPTLIRAAAKNFAHVTCLTHPDDYFDVITEMNRDREVSLDTRKKFAVSAFNRIAGYDLAIAVELSHQLGTSLRYGENPHQRAVLMPFENTDAAQPLASATVWQGKELSYNNWLDADHAFKCCSELSALNLASHACVIVKHGTPCGTAVHENQMDALNLAWEADSISAFGSIIAFNQPVTLEVASSLKDRFIEVMIAPSFDEKALEVLAKKKNLRLLEVPLKKFNEEEWTLRSIHGGLLSQSEDELSDNERQTVTQRAFPDSLNKTCAFGLVVTKYLKSNCIGIFAPKSGGQVVLASGVGQPNRLDCITRLAKSRLAEKSEDLTHAVLISDAFFPFRDSIDAASELGIQFIVQPGGSVRDAEVIAACDERNISMQMTGHRHFRH